MHLGRCRAGATLGRRFKAMTLKTQKYTVFTLRSPLSSSTPFIPISEPTYTYLKKMAEQVPLKKNLPATEEPVKEEKGLSDDACVATVDQGSTHRGD